MMQYDRGPTVIKQPKQKNLNKVIPPKLLTNKTLVWNLIDLVLNKKQSTKPKYKI
ncbi:MAG: hypothetical protein ACQBVK_01685 [Candidatus Phytoplasma sp. TWB_XP]